MKKIQRVLTILGLTALIAALTACGGTERKFSTGDLTAVVEAGAFSEELEELDAGMAFALYRLSGAGLSQEDLTDCAVLRSAGATCEEGAVLVFAGEDGAKSALTALQDYLDGQIASNVDYRPNEIPKLENALLEQRGSTVVMVVAADVDAARTALGLD